MINWSAFVPATVLVSLIRARVDARLEQRSRVGTQCAVAGICGRLAAFVLLIGLVMAGLGSLVASSLGTLTLIKWVGVGYLAWLGVAALHRAWRAQEAMQTPLARDGVWAPIGNEFVVGIAYIGVGLRGLAGLLAVDEVGRP